MFYNPNKLCQKSDVVIWRSLTFCKQTFTNNQSFCCDCWCKVHIDWCWQKNIYFNAILLAKLIVQQSTHQQKAHNELQWPHLLKATNAKLQYKVLLELLYLSHVTYTPLLILCMRYVTMLIQNEAMGAATASDGKRAPTASVWVRIMTSCIKVLREAYSSFSWRVELSSSAFS